MTAETASIASSLAAVRARLARAAERASRDPASVLLVGVSKTFPAERVRAAYDAGLRHFGENRVQEGAAKAAELALADATWHLIGHLQTNKARQAARAFQMVHSVDSVRVADALSAEAVKAEKELAVLIEVNYGGEESKFGVAPDGALALARHVAAQPSLRLVGLMTVAPHVPDPEDVRPVFRGMRELGDRVREALGHVGEWHLSMGMTNDFEVAIQEGATIVRVGRAIFGERG